MKLKLGECDPIIMFIFFRFHKIYTPGEALDKTIQDKDEVYVYETADIQDNKQVGTLYSAVLSNETSDCLSKC